MSMPDMRKILPVIKTVSAGCNIRCKYCYYRQINQGEVKIMDEKVLRALLQKTIDFSESDPVVFIWHGGEPLLAGIDFYQKVVTIESEVKGNKKIGNDIQTNATLISRQWAEFFAEKKFNVGISVDGPKEVHDYCRVFSNGEGSLKSAMRGLRELQSVGLKPGAIALVSKISIGREREIFDFFADNGINKFLLKPCCEIDPLTQRFTDYSVSPEEYIHFMLNIMEIWLEKNNPDIVVRNLQQIMIKMAGGKASLCEFSGQCWLFPDIAFDGTVGPCNNFPSSGCSYGNIINQSWEELFRSPGFIRFINTVEKIRDCCQKCEWLENCYGCCSHYAFSQNNDWQRNIFCEAKKKLFQRVAEIMK